MSFRHNEDILKFDYFLHTFKVYAIGDLVTF
jgi:hypothetical protein